MTKRNIWWTKLLSRVLEGRSPQSTLLDPPRDLPESLRELIAKIVNLKLKLGYRTLCKPAYDIFILGSIVMQPVWFCAWRPSGQGVVWKGSAGKTMHARKKNLSNEMFGRSSSFWWTKPKKFPPCLDGYFGWKLGWIYCCFTFKVHCAYSKHCKNSKLTEYVARPIFKHPVKFQRNKSYNCLFNTSA